MKKLRIQRLFFFLILETLALSSPTLAQQSVKLSTYYPAPYGGYEKIRLVPNSNITPDTLCTSEGEMTYYLDTLDNTNNKLLICSRDPSGLTTKWQGATGWTLSGNNLHTSNTNYNVGVGTNTPQDKFEVNGVINIQGLKMPPGSSAGYVLMVDGTGNASWQPPPSGGSFSNLQSFDTPGTYSFTIPQGVTQVMVEGWGSGGGGGGGVRCGYCWQWYGNASSGGTGGTSSFGALITAGGGGGGREGGTCGGCGASGGGGTSSAPVNVSGQAGSSQYGGNGGFGAGRGGDGGCNCQCGGGGGGGAYGKGIFSVVAGTTYSVIVGQGGAAGDAQTSACGNSPGGNKGVDGRVLISY